MTPRPLLVLAAALAVSACGPDGPADSVAPVPPSALVLGADGVAGLGAATPFDTAAVRAALPPGFAVERQPGGGALWALRDGRLVLEVYPGEGGRVGRIDAVSDDVVGPDGARVGLQTFADLDGLDCEPGAASLDGRAVCRRRGSPVRYAFASRAVVPGQPLPPADGLAGALLERLVWTAE